MPLAIFTAVALGTKRQVIAAPDSQARGISQPNHGYYYSPAQIDTFGGTSVLMRATVATLLIMRFLLRLARRVN